MKQASIFSLMIFLSVNLIGQEIWERINPHPQENTINQLCLIPGTNKLIAAANRATIISTSDNGDTWLLCHNPAGIENKTNLEAIDFCNSQTGFATGWDSTIIKTQDGGNTWTEIESGFSGSFHEVYVLDPDNVLVSGWGELIIRSSDGGESWIEIDNPVEDRIMAIDFTNDTTGYMLSQHGDIMMTCNSGYDWDLLSVIPNQPISQYLFFMNDSVAFALSGGAIFKSLDSGIEWDTVFFDYWNIPKAICQGPTGKFVAVGDHVIYHGSILASDDGGNNWYEAIIPDFLFDLNDACFLNNNEVISVGYHCEIMYSDDQGESWISKRSQNKLGDIHEVQFINDQIGFLAGKTLSFAGIPSGQVHKTTDGGKSWEKICGGTEDVSVYFYNENIGFVGDNDPNILRTVDGGESWESIQVFGSQQHYIHVNLFYFLTENEGLLFAENHENGNHCGIIKKTFDGGQTWEEVYQEQGHYIDDVHFFNESRGIAVGSCYWSIPVYLETLDGGNTWEVSNVIDDVLYDICFLNNDTGYISAPCDGIYKTTDAANSWELIETSRCPQKISFVNSQIGYASTYHAPYVLKTINGGESWFELEQPSTNHVNDLHFFDEMNGLVFGDAGIIFKTQTGGVVGIKEKDPVSKAFFNLKISPNPFKEQVIISFAISHKDHIKISVFNMKGIEIKVLMDDILSEGRYSIIWNGYDEKDNKLSSGSYICKISSNSGQESKILVLH